MASIDAGLKEIEIMLCEDKLSKEQCIAIQLSHNSIEGKDDEQTLKELYSMLDNFDLKEYSGLNDEFNEFCNNLQKEIYIPNLNYQVLHLLFLQNELIFIKNKTAVNFSDICSKFLS